ncbi:unnamed protein product [Polarella glacialis]|uniref:Uncharacterized protein n=1 Tax=Polarella glacialis TaxID=89957 RepID=A0A813FLE1_POLGL|nr:unnamed protein product [Polarella glacialis]
MVRKLTELHNLLALGLPLAPNLTEGTGAISKTAKKNERRRKESMDSQDGESDSSGWAIASRGDSDVEPMVFSPKHRSMSRQVSHGPPDLELPPPMPEHKGTDGNAATATQAADTSPVVEDVQSSDRETELSETVDLKGSVAPKASAGGSKKKSKSKKK